MEEQKIENFGTEQAPMPAPVPMPATSAEQPQQMNAMPSADPEVERMQIPMQPIDLSAQSGMQNQPSGITMEMEAPAGGVNKKAMIIGGVVVALLVLAGGAFFAWRSMNVVTPETTVAEQASAPTALPTVPTTTPTVVVPPAPEQDDISVIEQDLGAFNAGGIDAELEANLNDINNSL